MIFAIFEEHSIKTNCKFNSYRTQRQNVLQQPLYSSIKGTVASFEAEELEWRPATATWYGSPDGDGSDGGACGYGGLVDQKPLKARVGAVSPILFKGGEGCGACYKVKCMQEGMCSEKPVTIIVTDECPGGYCAFGRTHFDLSGAAFGHMATAGKTPELLNSGELPVLYRRTLCEYPGKNITFHINEGSTDYWFSILIEYEDGDGDVGAVHLKEADSDSWMEMKHLWGANWSALGGPMKAPFSLRITSLSSKRTLSARNVIPHNWFPNATYRSRLNFDD
ncbi:hypothetical protein SUGI_0842190 [Cryptomeria japonica]|nr:hypothetical protein SUGI_0842190 [Cryptomeria japonica]